MTLDIRKLMKERDAANKATKISSEKWNTYNFEMQYNHILVF